MHDKHGQVQVLHGLPKANSAKFLARMAKNRQKGLKSELYLRMPKYSLSEYCLFFSREKGDCAQQVGDQSNM